MLTSWPNTPLGFGFRWTPLPARRISYSAPTAVAGFADLPTLEPAKRRVAVVHAASNTVALLLFTRSWWARTRGRRGAGILDGLLASVVATFGGYLGGWMAFGQAPAARDAAEPQPVSRLAAVR